MNLQRSPLSLSSLILVLALGATSCTKKRDQKFVQGQGLNLETVADWDGKTFPIETGEILGKPDTTTAQNGLTVGAGVQEMNSFDFVSIRSPNSQMQTLLGTPPFRGKEKTSGVYQGMVRLTDNYLKIYKVATKDNLPSDEHPSIAETLSDGRVAIPLVGYKISSYYRVENAKTGNEEDTHQLVEIPEPNRTKATHLKVDWTSREFFEAEKKIDVFPYELFFAREKDKNNKIVFKPYEWYFAETVVDRSMDDDTIIGESANKVDSSGIEVGSRVKIIPREKTLKVVASSRDERLSDLDASSGSDINLATVLTIPTDWVDYRLKQSGTDKALKDEEAKERRWAERSFLKLDLPEIESAYVNQAKNTRVLDIEIDKNYFGFSVQVVKGESTQKIRYSFLRADRDRLPYAAKRSFRNDRKMFGFFTSTKPFIPNWEYYTAEDSNRRIQISRLNPDAPEIVFHLSAATPKWLEETAEKAIQAWDDAFQKALADSSRKIKVRLSKDRVQLGDLRYNTINIVSELSESGLLGFGPSVADPLSGEIISATSNVYASSILSIAASTVRRYIIAKLEETPMSAIPDAPTGGNNPSPTTDQRLAKNEKIAWIQKQLEAKRHGHAHESPESTFKKTTTGLDRANEIAKNYAEKHGHQCNALEHFSFGDGDATIQNTCPAVDAFIANHKNDDLSATATGLQNWNRIWDEAMDPRTKLIETCATEITKQKLLSTLIHELGHNLGLRHNFYGSVDQANFPKEAESSSIMEYTAWEKDRLTTAGPYDVAAIRFGYADQVEMNDGSIVNLDPKNSITENLTAKQLAANQMKSYLFCTDEEAYNDLKPMCTPHDSGVTPKEIVEFAIAGFQRELDIRKSKRALKSAIADERLAMVLAGQYMDTLHRIYTEWRFELAKYVKRSNQYLQGIPDAKTYAQVLDGMKNDPIYGASYAKYYEASRLAVNFLTAVAYHPDQYCVFKDGSVTEFAYVKDQVEELTRGQVFIRSCAESATHLKREVIGEFGLPVTAYSYERASDLDEHLRRDQTGLGVSREIAYMFLTQRLPNANGILNDFIPVALDEPSIRQDLISRLFNRLVNGVDLSMVGFRKPVPLFRSERELVSTLAQMTRAGMMIPGEKLGTWDRTATTRNFTLFNVHRPDPQDDLKRYAAVLDLGGVVPYVAVSKNHVFAVNLIQRFNSNQSALSSKPVDEAMVQNLTKTLMATAQKTETVKTWTIKDFIDYLNALPEIEKDFGVFGACVIEKSAALASIDAAVQVLTPLFQQAQAAGEEEFNKFLALNFMDTVLAGNPRYQFLMVEDQITAMLNRAAACKKVADDQLSNVGETKEHQALIMDVLNAFAN